MQGPEELIQFWFVEHGYEDWFGGDAVFDEKCTRFAGLHAQAARGELWSWRETSEGRLAEIVLLDQFSRQLLRGSPEAFAQDKMALALAQESIAGGHDMAVDGSWVTFFYLPFMHAESLIIQDEGVRLYEAMGDEKSLDYMKLHRDTVARFGRFPFRNKALGRTSTPEEIAYMEEAGDRSF